MACGTCGGATNRSTSAAKSFVVTAPDGTKKTYRTEVEAVSAAKRVNGTYRPQR